MQEFEYSGMWWLPEEPDNEVCGTLTFTEDSGLVLNLIGSFSDYSKALQSEREGVPVILGITDRRLVTLTDCMSLGTSLSFPGFPRERLRARFAYVGAEQFLDPHNIMLNSVTIRFTHLEAWAHVVSGGGVRLIREPDGTYRYEVLYTSPEKLVAVTSKGTVTVVANVTFPVGFRREHTIVEAVEIRISRDAPETLHWWLTEFVNPLQNLMSLATNAPNAITRLTVTSPAVTTSGNDGRGETPFEVYYQGRYAERSSKQRRELMPDEMLFTLEDVKERFEEVVNAWLRVADELSDVCDLFFSVHYRPLYTEHRFSNMAQAAEGYHRASSRFSNAVLPEDRHSKRIEEIISSAPDGHRAWLKGQLQWSNEPNLRRRLKDLCVDVVDVSGPLVGDTKRFVNAVVEDRNRLIHPQSGSEKPDGLELYFLSRQLGFIMQACFMRELGMPLDIVTRQRDYQFEVRRQERRRATALDDDNSE